MCKILLNKLNHFKLFVNFFTFAKPYLVDLTGPAVQKLTHVWDFDEVATIDEISCSNVLFNRSSFIAPTKSACWTRLGKDLTWAIRSSGAVL